MIVCIFRGGKHSSLRVYGSGSFTPHEDSSQGSEGVLGWGWGVCVWVGGGGGGR